MTAVFGWFFEELLCKEVKGSGAVVRGPDRTSLHFYGYFYFFLCCSFLLRQKRTGNRRPENEDGRFRVVL